jgi:TonB family protein
MKPAPGKAASAANQPANPAEAGRDENPIVEAASTQRITTTPSARGPASKPAPSIWLASSDAEARLLSRTEPQYPPEALAVHRAGSVVLKASVSEDGIVSDVSVVSGDPILARAAISAVRTWRYQPYRLHDQAAPFQTEVTLSFNLPQ